MTDPTWAWQPEHRRWLDGQAAALADFARQSVRPEGGFWWQRDDGRPERSEPLHTWIGCRMTHVFALAHLAGDPTAGAIVDHGVASLQGLLRDPVHDGWFSSV